MMMMTQTKIGIDHRHECTSYWEAAGYPGGWFTKQTLDDTSSTDKYTLRTNTQIQIHSQENHDFQLLNKQDECEEDEW